MRKNQEEDIILFIGKWDKREGISILEQYPPSLLGLDLEHLAWKFFFFFENFYVSEDSKGYKETIFQLPIKDEGKSASILIDSFPSERTKRELKIYLIAVILPDYFTLDQLEDFNEELQSLNKAFRKDNTLHLDDYINKFYTKLNVTQTLQDSEVSLSDTYTHLEALEDFKKGLQFFSEKAYKISYMIIKKSYLQFKKENEIRLLLKASYFIGNILFKLEKYKVALDYYIELKELAKKLNHQQYYEIGKFMAGFSALKIRRYPLALKLFKELSFSDFNFIKPFDFYFLYGKTLKNVYEYNKSIQILTKATNSLNITDASSQRKEKLAEAYLELAHSYFIITTEKMLKNPRNQNYNNEFQKIIEIYEKASEIFSDFNNYSNMIICNQLIGNIYENMNKRNKAITFYRNAIEFTKENNDVLSKMQIFDLLINNLIELGKKMEVIREIDQMLYKVRAYAFLDLPTIAKYHTKLGKIYASIDRNKEALSEFLIALNIYDDLNIPREEALDLLDEIITIYIKTNQNKYLEYYRNKLKHYQHNIQKLKSKEKSQTLLTLIKDLWILKTDGEIIFSYTPESKSNPQLLGGFLSAILNFSFELTSEQLNAIKLGFDQFFLYGNGQTSYIVIGRVNINQSESVVREHLKTVFNSFGETFGSILNEEEYKPSNFSKFVEILKQL